MRFGGLGAAVVATVVGVAAVGALTGPTIAAQVMHPRDDAAFLDYVTTYSSDWGSSADPTGPARDRAWVDSHLAEVTAAGLAACDWLSKKPNAPEVDPSGQSDSGALSVEYVGIDVSQGLYDDPGSGAVKLPISPAARYTVVAGAWSYLCWSTHNSRTAPMTLEDD